jgi:hypothetical protein
LKVQPFTADLAGAVKEFNARLRAGGADPELLFPEFQDRQGLEERLLMVDEDAVRGAFILQHQDFWLGKERTSIAHFRLPLSEGIVNRKYANVGMQLVREALRRQPRLFALGMGGRHRPLPRLLEAMKWQVWDVPFYFFVNRPARFLHGIRALRTTWWRRAALDTAAFSGLGWIGACLWNLVGSKTAPAIENAETIKSFSPWANELWNSCTDSYSFLAVRDSATLSLRYPDGSARFHRKVLRRNGRAAGWFVALDTAMRDHRQFGNLRVGTIADVFARPQDATAVIQAAARFLRAQDVDVIISNQMHAAWGDGLRAAGFLQAPSNFALAVSLSLKEFCGDGRGIHMNRGDGDGPIHL